MAIAPPNGAPSFGNKDQWADMAQEYIAFSSSASVAPSIALVNRANEAFPFSRATSILDNGCGPGPVITKILSSHGSRIPDTATLRACDFSEGMVNVLRKTQESKIALGDVVWKRLETSIADAHTLEGIEDSSMSHVVAGFLYMLLSDPHKALLAAHRVLKDHGVLVLSCWKGSQWMEIMQLANVIRPDKAMNLPPAWMSTEGVKGELQAAGFKNVGAEYIATAMPFESHQRTNHMFMTKLPPVVNALKDFSEEEKTRFKKMMDEKLWELCPEEPGTLTGTAIIAWGKK